MSWYDDDDHMIDQKWNEKNTKTFKNAAFFKVF